VRPLAEKEPGNPDEDFSLAVERAVRFIEYRPRSTGETRSRLRRWGYAPATCERVAAYLVEAGILDDHDFARLFMDELLRKGLGRYRVRSELIKKKLDRELVDEVMERYPLEEELERAKGVAEKRFVRTSEPDATSSRKVTEYLMRRGYSREVAAAACRLLTQVDTQTSTELE